MATLPKPRTGSPPPTKLALIAFLAVVITGCTSGEECPAGRTDERPSDPIEWRPSQRAVGGREYIYHGEGFSFTFTPPRGYMFRFSVQRGKGPEEPSHIALFVLRGKQSQSFVTINPYTGEEHGERFVDKGLEACNEVFDDLVRGFKPRE